MSIFGLAQSWWGNVSKTERIEIDLIAESTDGKALLVGECKWTESENAARLLFELGTKAEKLPFAQAIHLLISTKKSFSVVELQRQLGHRRYEPIWSLLHKLREIMGKRDEMYSLSGVIELDEVFFSMKTTDDEKKSL